MQMSINLFLLHILQAHQYLAVNLMILLVLFFHTVRGRILLNYLDGSSVLTVYGIYSLDWYASQTNVNSNIFKCVQQNWYDIGGRHRESRYY
jgi:hypothetical protein